ncbi:MAG: glycosyltransferase [Anaerolineae bacterium]|nr:glycosyltransferase [Candidatus Roseilinea sp.]MDW8448963.1 glycosyltransferase [Anaerolineae bacterium]
MADEGESKETQDERRKTDMNIGIYNRWLATMGGGEKMSLSAAEHLSRAHEVTVISHAPVEVDTLAQRLNLDLSRVKFSFIPDEPPALLEALTENYDVFINASHMDIPPTRARRSVMLVYFPGQIYLDLPAKIRAHVGMAIRKLLFVPTFAEGFYGAEIRNGRQLRRTHAMMRIELPPSRARLVVKFNLSAERPDVSQATIYADGERVGEIALPSSGTPVPCAIELSGKGQFASAITIRCPPPTSKDRFCMALSDFQIEHPRYRLYQWLFEDKFKEWGLRLHGVPAQLSTTRIENLARYHAIWSISEFTRTWVRRYWRRDSAILTPPVDVEAFAPAPGGKRNVILSVGRFFAGSHNKKHVEMVTAFKGMVDQGLRGWELHLAGSLTPDRMHVEYLERVQREAQGYPIVLHVNAPFSELQRLYGEAAIYWHASGFGEDEAREPIKFEHFGITTVEAMAAGCAPVVIAKGGQPEIVQHGRNGFLWRSLSELQSFTRELIENRALRETLAGNALADSRRYDKPHFQARLDELLKRLNR